MEQFSYQNIETRVQNGGKTVRKVIIKRGKGYKSISNYKRGRMTSTVRKPIHPHHVMKIKNKKFIKGFFDDCKGCKTRKRKE
jgi:hypothetical protein